MLGEERRRGGEEEFINASIVFINTGSMLSTLREELKTIF